MASTLRVLILSFFLLFLFSCSNADNSEEDPTSEVMLLECKPMEWPDGSTSYSIYAIIGTNQTKVAHAPACRPVETDQIGEYFPEKDIVTMLDCSKGDSLLYYFMEKTEEGVKIEQSLGEPSSTMTITTFRGGKFYFN